MPQPDHGKIEVSSSFSKCAMPRFVTDLARQQAQILMQPALIRVIDNIRKQLDVSRWQGRYEDEMIWPEGTTDQQQQTYTQLQQQMEAVAADVYDQLQAQLDRLPQPQHLYTLCLSKDEHEQKIDLWELCYQVCCTNYEATQLETALEIDTTLFDEEINDIDWVKLYEKAKQLVKNAFEQL
ncbi:MAG: hypothetical protein AAGC54_12670 [Cyanobacteria bacterium P01_F01_bin.4]